MVVFHGTPASGKSFFAAKYFAQEGYRIINGDTLGSTDKCVAACRKSLEEGQSCVIDNTNMSRAKRRLYLDEARAKGEAEAVVFFLRAPLQTRQFC